MRRFYWTNPDVFETEVEVKVVGNCKVTTDPIIFHPDEGGQPADKGAIGDSNVCDVEVIDGQIVHTLDKPLGDGKHVARLDRQHRFYTASQHTAQHIISGIAERQFGLATTGVHIGLERCTVDFDKAVDWDTAMALEQRSMEAVTLNIPVETLFNDTDVRIRADSKEIESDVIRVVKIGDYDRSACCGAHVRTTGQIGTIRIFDIESKKKGTRMSFLAGRKALEQAQLEMFILRELRKSASCSTSGLPAVFQKTVERAKELTKEVNRLWSLTLPALVESAKIIEVESTKIGIQVADIPTKLVAKLAAMIAASVDGAGIAVSDVNVAVSADRMNANDLLREIQETVGGKGGGSPRAANGRLSRPVTSDELVAILKNR